MTSWDYFVGFKREPAGLEAFLDSHGYALSENQPKRTQSGSDRNYESKEGLISLFYYSKAPAVKEGEVPDWKRAGFKITSELMIVTKDAGSAEEALRLSEATARKYNGILYDSVSDEYFRSEEL